MDGVTLLREAEATGLVVAANADRLVIRGPRRAEPIARTLLEHKSAVLEALARRSGTDEKGGCAVGAVELLTAACELCGSSGPVLIKMIGSRGAYWMCGACRLKLGGGA